jgi:hypothetical protein
MARLASALLLLGCVTGAPTFGRAEGATVSLEALLGQTANDTRQEYDLNLRALSDQVDALTNKAKTFDARLAKLEGSASPEGADPVSGIDGTTGDETGSSRNLYGFFLQSYRNPKATLEVVKGVRKHFKDAPLFLISDLGGYDFQALCDKYPPCHFELAKRKFGKVTGSFRKGMAEGRPREDVRIWFERLVRAEKYVDSKFMILLEDDTSVDNYPAKEPPFDAGGVDLGRDVEYHNIDGVLTPVVTNGYDPYTQEYSPKEASQTEQRPMPGVCYTSKLRKRATEGNWGYVGWGMTGGSYLRTASFMKIMNDPKWWDRCKEMEELDDRVAVFDDATLAAIIMDYGQKLRPWDEVHFPYEGPRNAYRGVAYRGTLKAEEPFDQAVCKKIHGDSSPCVLAFTTSDKNFIGEGLAEADGFKLDGDTVVALV